MSKQDRQGVRTAAELEQKYNFGDLKKNTKDQRQDMSKLLQMFSQFAAGVNAKIAELEKMADVVYPVGSLYLSVNDAAPGELFGGTWERFAEGRVLVGVDESAEAYQAAGLAGDIVQGTGTTVQPYITCYMWKRTK